MSAEETVKGGDRMKNISSGELKEASLPRLREICETLREEIVDTVSVRGGHLASNLGVVELTVALHRVFDFPTDKIVFDVGHQCYTHKLLSGRAAAFSTLRSRGGLSGFPKRGESEYDCYETGHAGTAISAALGIAKARDLKNAAFDVIALVGDGSFHNGLIYEALNSLKILNTRVLIILNDNGMSISPTVGGTHELLSEMKEGDAPIEDVALFERYGLTYMGVYNGNDLEELLPALQSAKNALSSGSVLLHVSTRKGQGFAFCEREPERTHGISLGKSGAEYSTALGEELTALARRDERIVAVTAAMTDALGLRPFFREFPDRAFDVGICEEHACVLCAALATEGMRPYYAIYSTFLQRAYDEVIHDICGQKLPVTFCIDRAGVTGADGETHQGVFDLSYLSPVPNLTIAVPKNIAEFRAMLRASAEFPGPLAIRYPREGEEGELGSFEMLKFELLHSNMSDIIIYAAGERCLRLAEQLYTAASERGFCCSVANARFVKPVDRETILSRTEKYIITLEDNVLAGGLGDAVARVLREAGLAQERVLRSFGYRDAFIPHGQAQELARDFGLDFETILAYIMDCHARG